MLLGERDDVPEGVEVGEAALWATALLVAAGQDLADLGLDLGRALEHGVALLGGQGQVAALDAPGSSRPDSGSSPARIRCR